MNGFATFLVALVTSIATAAGTVYAIQRYDLLPPKPVPAPAVTDTAVPKFEGLSEDDARARAERARLSLFVASREPNPDMKPGSVLRQSVPAGVRVPRAQAVSVVIAEEVLRVPNLSGMPVTDASARLEKLGYSLQVGGSVADPTVPAGTIIGQSPKAETAVPKGGTVMVQVSSGPGDVDVPKLVGLSLNKAKTEIEKLGLKAAVRWVSLAETDTYVVLNQKPAAGQKLKPGSDVQITVNR